MNIRFELCEHQHLIDGLFLKIDLIFEGRQARNVTCYWGGKSCSKWTNRIIEQPFCDDPGIGHISQKFCMGDSGENPIRWTTQPLHGTDLTHDREFW